MAFHCKVPPKKDPTTLLCHNNAHHSSSSSSATKPTLSIIPKHGLPSVHGLNLNERWANCSSNHSGLQLFFPTHGGFFCQRPEARRGPADQFEGHGVKGERESEAGREGAGGGAHTHAHTHTTRKIWNLRRRHSSRSIADVPQLGILTRKLSQRGLELAGESEVSRWRPTQTRPSRSS